MIHCDRGATEDAASVFRKEAKLREMVRTLLFAHAITRVCLRYKAPASEFESDDDACTASEGELNTPAALPWTDLRAGDGRLDWEPDSDPGPDKGICGEWVLLLSGSASLLLLLGLVSVLIAC